MAGVAVAAADISKFLLLLIQVSGSTLKTFVKCWCVEQVCTVVHSAEKAVSVLAIFNFMFDWADEWLKTQVVAGSSSAHGVIMRPLAVPTITASGGNHVEWFSFFMSSFAVVAD